MPLLLDSFDRQPQEAPAPDDPYDVGYEEGYAAGRTIATDEISAMQADIARAIADLSFSYAEVESDVLRKLQPLLHAIARQLVPTTNTPRLLMAITEALETAAKIDVRQKTVVTIHPTLSDQAQEILGQQLSGFDLRSDPAVPPLAAIISAPAYETMLDVGAVSDVLSNALLALSPPEKKIANHG